MLSFYSFPQGIQQMVFSELAPSKDLAPFACGNKHWQEFFKVRTSRHLIIRQDLYHVNIWPLGSPREMGKKQGSKKVLEQVVEEALGQGLEQDHDCSLFKALLKSLLNNLLS